MARNPTKVKNDLTASSLVNSTAGLDMSRGQRGAIIGRLNQAMGTDENRRTALAWLFESRGEMSSKALDGGQWCALWEWIGFYQDEMGEWQTNGDFPVEAAFVLTEALRAQAKVKPSEIDEELSAPTDLVLQAVALGGVVTAVEGNPPVPQDSEVDVDYWLRKKISAFIDGKDDL